MKVLFIGNSYTFFNDMPELFRALAEENDKKAEVFSVTKGGWSIPKYLDNKDEHTERLNAALENCPYDIAILQDHSLATLKSDVFLDGMKRMKERIGDGAKRIILYQTWARKHGSKTLDDNGITHDQHHAAVTKEYESVASIIGAELTPVGRAFNYGLTNHPETELYDEDKSHPSYNGSCLVTVMHYKTVYGEFPSSFASLKLSDSDLRSIVDTAKAAFSEYEATNARI